MMLKVCLSTFIFVFVVVSSTNAPSRPTPPPPSYVYANHPEVTITRPTEMTASMQLDAVDAFKRAYTHLNSNTDRCSIVRQIFLEKYPDYKWQVAMYKAYSIQSVMRINIKVEGDSYILFATQK